MQTPGMEPRIATSLEELPTREEMLSLTGIEFMRAIRDGEIAGPPIGALMNFWVDRVEDGILSFRGIPKFESFNPMGTLHGGWYGTILDSCMACAVMTKLPKGAAYTTLEYKVNLVRAIPLGAEVIAEGTVQHIGRTTGVATGEIRGAADGKLYATGSTTCIVMQMKPA